ncbi:MAG TPA: hypothetical protein PLS50_05725 [Candidatus Dojkabacteria bacterium]|nr:hypothetical protein [Candidatus Dojkabacteria bacterium]
MDKLRKENAALNLSVITLHRTIDDILLNKIITNRYCSDDEQNKLLEEQKQRYKHWESQKKRYLDELKFYDNEKDLKNKSDLVSDVNPNQ